MLANSCPTCACLHFIALLLDSRSAQSWSKGHCKCVGLLLAYRFRILACSSCSRVMSSCLSLKMPSISLQQRGAASDDRQAP